MSATDESVLRLRAQGSRQGSSLITGHFISISRKQEQRSPSGQPGEADPTAPLHPSIPVRNSGAASHREGPNHLPASGVECTPKRARAVDAPCVQGTGSPELRSSGRHRGATPIQTATHTHTLRPVCGPIYLPYVPRAAFVAKVRAGNLTMHAHGHDGDMHALQCSSLSLSLHGRRSHRYACMVWSPTAHRTTLQCSRSYHMQSHTQVRTMQCMHRRTCSHAELQMHLSYPASVRSTNLPTDQWIRDGSCNS